MRQQNKRAKRARKEQPLKSGMPEVDRAAVFARAAAIRNASSEAGQLERLNQWLEVALNNMARGLSMFDKEQKLLLCNKYYRQIYELPEELTRPGTPLAEIVRYHVRRETGHDDPEELIAQEMWIETHLETLSKGRSFSHIQQLRDGRTILVTYQPLGDGSWVDLQEDITERRQAEERIAWLARHDALTEIPNRFHFHEQLADALASLPAGEGLAVHWIDLDRFKDINDGLGHPVGDALLKSIGGRLAKQIRKPDFVGRLGGDEFAIVQRDVTRAEDAIAFARRILAMFGRTHQLLGHRVDVGASIGIAMAPQDGVTADDLLKNADIALYQAKFAGRGRLAVFDPAFQTATRSRRELATDLREALEKGQLELFYQPIRDLKSRRITSCEALMRWRHPEYGLIAPNDFIPLAEDTGLIVPMGAWALRQACTEACGWPSHIGVTVNISASQLSGCDLVDIVVQALRVSGLSARRLELEITESVLLRDDADVLAILHSLRAAGVRIALDDFGTAFASLSYLRSFPFDRIKIDRSFVRDLPDNVDCAAIVDAIAALARRLRIQSVIEGVETSEQLACAAAAGCDEVQGFYFNRPVPASCLAELFLADADRAPTKRS